MKQSVAGSKIKILSICIHVFFLLNVAFLFRWQVLEYDKYNALARERIVDNKIPEIRGEILASDGTALAYSEPRFNIVVYKTELEFAEKHNKQTRREFVDKVSQSLQIEPGELEKALNTNSSWITIKRLIFFDQKESVLNLKRDSAPDAELMGLRVENTSQRVYPYDALACHVIGFVGKNPVGESVGSAGLEHYWEGLLKEQEGYNLSEVDSFGNIIPLDNLHKIDARRGAAVYTTIDKNLQQKAEEKIEKGVKKYRAKSGSIIIMNPKTGAIMALANYPEYNLNEYNKVENADDFKNVAISDPAELGSVGKAFTMAAALNEGKIEPNTVVTKGHSGCTTVKEKERDWKVCTYDKKPKGAMTATQALVDSDNLALYEISKLIGPQKLHDYLAAFGIGSRTDVDMSGESDGVLRDADKWSNVDSATYSYGHGYQMTPLQAITGIGSIANDGNLMRPYVVSKVIESDGTVKEYRPTVVNKPVTVNTANKLREMMYEVFKSNLDENRYKSLSKYKIGMKSGTATIPYKDKAGYSSDINATYIGFDESDDATFIMLVKLEAPQAVEKLSYYSARIVWLDTFVQIKDYLGVPKIGK